MNRVLDKIGELDPARSHMCSVTTKYEARREGRCIDEGALSP